MAHNGGASGSRAVVAGSGERGMDSRRHALARTPVAQALVAGRLRVGHRIIGAPSPELRDDGAIQESSVTP